MALSATRAAILLAGGPADDISALAPGAPNKAFVPIAGVTLARRTLDALRSSSRIGRVVAVAPLVPAALAELHAADEIRPAGATMSMSLRTGLARFAPGELVLVAASDLPILTVAAIDEFLDIAERSDADLVYACVERATHERRFPEMPHTWAHLRDGTFCGAGLVAMRPRAFTALERFLARLGAARKNPLQLASIFGYDVLVLYALRRLTISGAQQRATSLLGVEVAAAQCTHPEIAVNVDRVSDVALAENVIRGARSGAESDPRASRTRAR
jgi:molybdopterin-guanine dinucleotide biosynthesis protein A